MIEHRQVIRQSDLGMEYVACSCEQWEGSTYFEQSDLQTVDGRDLARATFDQEFNTHANALDEVIAFRIRVVKTGREQRQGIVNESRRRLDQQAKRTFGWPATRIEVERTDTTTGTFLVTRVEEGER